MTREEARAFRPGYPMMVCHTITIGTDPKTGADLAWCGSLSARSARSCAARGVARMLVEAGEADGPVSAIGADGAPRYTVPSLFSFARRTLLENPRLRSVLWHPVNFAAMGVVEAEDGGSEGSDGEMVP